MFDELNHAFMVLGICFNTLVLLAIARNTPRSLRDYSLIIFNTAVNDLLEMTVHFLLNARMFLNASTVVHMANGPCRLVGDLFCAGLFEAIHDTIVHTCTLIAISFWYRRTLRGEGPVGWWKLQAIIVLAYLPHISQFIAFFHVTVGREALEPFIASVYGPNHSSEYAVRGFLDATDPPSAYTIGHFLIWSTMAYIFIFFKRRAVLGALAENACKMSTRTREMHRSLIRVLSIHSLLPSCVLLGFALMFSQMANFYHSVEIEHMIYSIAVVPAIVNPVLTIYFITPYR
ncbi:hypothetical protein PMAYCL1PPCAC_26207, partial [Pristionchus mayeri]